ncbi:MAG: GNAT family N-acetyltransferase [Phycisphaeraceae bacterium]|nr:GNAT family N-acetyltransferase [Phycisphaeraceae bacterium]
MSHRVLNIETAGRVILRRGVADEVMPLRQEVLYAPHTPHTVRFDDDQHPLTRHYVAEVADSSDVGESPRERIVGCLTLVPGTFDGRPAWHMRALAVAPGVRCMGIGRALVRFAEEDVGDRPEFELMWCNAVAGAVVFYESMGWEMVDEVHLIKGVGSHFKLLRRHGDRPSASPEES